MSEAAPEAPIKSVLQEIRRIDRLHAAIERRTRGVAWMVWGLVIPGVMVTYSYAGSRYLSGESAVAPSFPVLWVPWVVVGALVTYALWRSAGLTLDVRYVARRGIRRFAVFVAVVFTGYLLLHFFHEPLGLTNLVGSAVFVVIAGLAALAMGATGLACADREERALWSLAGAVLLTGSALGLAATRGDQDAALAVFGWLGPGLTALVWTANGLYLTLRG